MQTKKNETWVGAFIIIAICSIVFICLKVANVCLISNAATYRISASFDNIGNLKVRSPIRIGGVVIGRVADIILDPETYLPRVIIDIKDTYNQIPDTSSLAIETSGILGEQYLVLNIGFSDPEMGTSILKDGSVIQNTRSAITLESIIGQFLYRSDSAKIYSTNVNQANFADNCSISSTNLNHNNINLTEQQNTGTSDQ